ncbi:hypothetical protein [Nonomuraea ceibae]|uniref:hypothetical protein n=1 Tax=Nonomuraea ceibae TaxID=1935170 RepID=UPI001C604614|nr:hypothetical protein [Nonomuraea ceibae]
MNDDDALFETIASKLDEARDLLGAAVTADTLTDMQVGIAVAAVFLEKLARILRGDFSDVLGSQAQGSASQTDMLSEARRLIELAFADDEPDGGPHENDQG